MGVSEEPPPEGVNLPRRGNPEGLIPAPCRIGFGRAQAEGLNISALRSPGLNRGLNPLTPLSAWGNPGGVRPMDPRCYGSSLGVRLCG